jgi:pimeloyl-ACP methyl ester carboxylesterase
MHEDPIWRAAVDPSGNATRELHLERPDKRRVTGALWLPEAARPVRALIVFGHGASGDRYQAPIPYLAKRFTREADCAAFAMDGPVHGLRQVGPGGRAAFRVELERPKCVDDMVEDWQVAIAAAQREGAIGTMPLAYFGLSMGSIFGIPLLATRSDVRVATVGLLGVTGAVAMLGQRLLQDAARIDCPLLFLMQLEDELFDRSGYLALFDALRSKDKRLHANPGLHPEIPAEEVDFAFEFMRARLGNDVPRRIVNPLAS